MRVGVLSSIRTSRSERPIVGRDVMEVSERSLER